MLTRNPVTSRAAREPARRPRRARIVRRAVSESLEARTLLAFGPIGPEFRANTMVAGDQT